MQRVLSGQQLRELDRLAAELCGVGSLVLMENAGRGAADFVAASLALGPSAPRHVVVACGGGNNGGDGYVIARRLALLGARVEVFALAAESELRGDALINYRAWLGCGGRVVALTDFTLESFEQSLADADAVVDALLGTGLRRAVTGLYAAAIERITRAQARCFAVDIPSGLDADTGSIHGLAVRAAVTLTLAAYKPGLLTPNGVVHAGRVELLDIGVPTSSLPQVGQTAWLVERADVRSALPPRPVNAHKSSSGRVLVLAGSAGKIGAALLVAQGALRAGAGLVTLAALPEVADALDQRVLEAMTARLDPSALADSLAPLLEATDVVAIGPGLGFTPQAQRLVDHVVLEHAGLVVVDADALTRFKGIAEQLARARGPRILTPHPGEMSRLLDDHVTDVEANRFAAVERAVQLTQATVLLKGPRSL
ncbi:MAG TPA: NAD(P)H-hydrate epimerase, partial [Polyangiaceae bacterium]|nr:NAD(P)H-hydrate epimerase [Polyangiaceae bacterium]